MSVCVVVGATTKWQSDGRNTLLAHVRTVDDSDSPVGVAEHLVSPRNKP